MELQKVTVTADNLEEVRESIRPLDQRAEIRPGDVISTFRRQGADTIVFHQQGRAGLCSGGDSVWGDWDEETQTIQADEITLDLDGEEVSDAQ